MTDIGDQTEVQAEATRRFRVVSFLQRTGSRAQKRAVAAGHGAKRISGNIARGTWDQFTAPYSVLKQVGMMFLLVGGAVAVWYYTIIVGLMVFAAVGSYVLAIAGAVGFYVLVARFIYLPLCMLGARYFAGATDYHAQPKGMRDVGPIRTTAKSSPSFAGA